jgi:hypothetical protein
LIITNYQVRHLRAYGQQLAEKSRLPVRGPKNPGLDEVILPQRGNHRPENPTSSSGSSRRAELADTHRELLSRLSREYGQPVTVEKKEGQGLVFKVPEGKSSGGTRNASPEEAEILNKKLFEITQSIVYNNLG